MLIDLFYRKKDRKKCKGIVNRRENLQKISRYDLLVKALLVALDCFKTFAWCRML
jgi:hypothetical protein